MKKLRPKIITLLGVLFLVSGCAVKQPRPSPQTLAMRDAESVCESQAKMGTSESDPGKYETCKTDMYGKLLPAYMTEDQERKNRAVKIIMGSYD